jgi:hypothetical protein
MKDRFLKVFTFVFMFGWVCYFFGHRKMLSSWRIHLNRDDLFGHSAFRVTPQGHLVIFDPHSMGPKIITPAEIYLMKEHCSCILCGYRVATKHIVTWINSEKISSNLSSKVDVKIPSIGIKVICH